MMITISKNVPCPQRKPEALYVASQLIKGWSVWGGYEMLVVMMMKVTMRRMKMIVMTRI